MLTILFITATSLAAESSFVGGELDKLEISSEATEFKLELGGMWSSGNTDTRTLTLQYDAGHVWRRNRVSTSGGIIFGSSVVDLDGDGRLSLDEKSVGRVETSNRRESWVRYDKLFDWTGSHSVYGLVGGYSDIYAGYDARVNAQIGYSASLVTMESETAPTLTGELGFDAAREQQVGELNPQSVFAARGLVSMGFTTLRGVQFISSLESFVNVIDPEDTRLNTETSVVAALSEMFALKLSYKLNYDAQPVDGFARADQTGLVTVVTTVF
jgi:hypothetical protein